MLKSSIAETRITVFFTLDLNIDKRSRISLISSDESLSGGFIDNRISNALSEPSSFLRIGINLDKKWSSSVNFITSMSSRYYIDLDVLSRRFDTKSDPKIVREKEISTCIHELLEDGKISCICSQTLKDETRLVPHPIKRGWLFDLFKKPGFALCIMVSQNVETISQKLVKTCGFGAEDINDALHVTIAAVSKADFFWTFNTTHFIHHGRKQCIEDFFLKELEHTIVVSKPPNIRALRLIGQA